MPVQTRNNFDFSQSYRAEAYKFTPLGHGAVADVFDASVVAEIACRCCAAIQRELRER